MNELIKRSVLSDDEVIDWFTSGGYTIEDVCDPEGGYVAPVSDLEQMAEHSEVLSVLMRYGHFDEWGYFTDRPDGAIPVSRASREEFADFLRTCRAEMIENGEL